MATQDKKSFWQRSEDYAKESERGDHRTDQGRSRAVAETLEAGRELHAAKLLYRQALHRRQRALFDEPWHPRRAGRQPLGNLQPDCRGWAGRFARARREHRCFSSKTRRPAP